MADRVVNVLDVDGAPVQKRLDEMGDGYYAFAMTDGGPGWDSVFGISDTDGKFGAYYSTDATSTDYVAVTDSPTTDYCIVFTDIAISTGDAMAVSFFEEGEPTKVRYRCYMPANSGVHVFTPRGKIKFRANRRLLMQASATGAISCLVGYYQEASS